MAGGLAAGGRRLCAPLAVETGVASGLLTDGRRLCEPLAGGVCVASGLTMVEAGARQCGVIGGVTGRGSSDMAIGGVSVEGGSS